MRHSCRFGHRCKYVHGEIPAAVQVEVATGAAVLRCEREGLLGDRSAPDPEHASTAETETKNGGEGNDNHAEVVNDVCLNDPMGSSRKHFKVMRARQEDGSFVRCLDDMHLYDMLNCRWITVKSSLSPLPRKGHTLCVGRLRNIKTHLREEYLILFGGYSAHSNLMSNSLHICPLAEVIGSPEFPTFQQYSSLIKL